ncbi:MAG TPA: hypothetical protein VEF72_25720 [Mycobacterium sp.]|nr:hypothetical protein [Mycobacterium sp.]
MPETNSHGVHYHHLPDDHDPLAALNTLREAAGWSRCPLPDHSEQEDADGERDSREEQGMTERIVSEGVEPRSID